mgnify:FL=1
MRPVTTLSDDQRRHLARIQAEAFGAPIDDIGTWWALAGDDQVLAWPSEGPVRGAMVTIPMGLFVGGRSVPTVGLAGVAIDAAARGQRAGLQMMADHLRTVGAPLSALYASTRSFYARNGYGIAGVHQKARLPMEAVRGMGQAQPGWWRVDDTTWPAVEAAHRQVAARTFGLDRGPYIWRRIRRVRKAPKQSWAWGPVDAPRAWVVLSQESQSGTEFFRLQVHDLGALDAEAQAALHAFLGGFAAMCSTLERSFGARCPLVEGTAEHRAQVELVEPFLLRVVDVPAALRARGYPSGLRATVRLVVDDPLIEGNRGPWALTVADGRGRVEPSDAADVRVDIGGLAGLYAGHLSAEDLAMDGQAEGEEGELRLLSAVFGGPAPGLPDFF